MARPLRIEFPGAVYHVTSRGDRREPIVLGDEDREDLLGVLGQALQRPASITVQGDANQTLMSRSYQYDPTGNITQIVSDLGTTQFSYDPVGRLTQAKPDAALQTLGLPVEQYGYDRVHNRISSAHQPGAWSYNADNQLTQYPAIHNGQALATQVQYTPQGHTEKETNSYSTKIYHYGAAERLVLYEEVGGSNPLQASYRYDPFGRRISKTVAKGGTNQTIHFLYGDLGLLAEVNEQGVITKAYGWSPDAVDMWSTAPLWQAESSIPNASLSGSSTSYAFLHTDHLETPILGTNKAGMQIWKAVSEAFGDTRVHNGSAITMNLRLAGQYFDRESGLHHNYFRDYRPGVGRYAQRDPIGLDGGVNAYQYVEGNPLSYIDPEGLARFSGPAKGERGRTASPNGTPNPYKHMKQDPNNPALVIYKDANGKTVRKPKPADFDAVKKSQRGGALTGFLESLIPWWLMPGDLNRHEDEELARIRARCP